MSQYLIKNRSYFKKLILKNIFTISVPIFNKNSIIFSYFLYFFYENIFYDLYVIILKIIPNKINFLVIKNVFYVLFFDKIILHILWKDLKKKYSAFGIFRHIIFNFYMSNLRKKCVFFVFFWYVFCKIFFVISGT